MSDLNPPPQHIAIIMDGNGRWAQERKLPRVMGHKKGAEALRSIIEATLKRGIPYLSLYTFSSENWKRSSAEVRNILSLLEHYLLQEEHNLFKHDIRLKVIGDHERLPCKLRTYIEKLEDASSSHKRLTVQIAFSYGGRDEILQATQRIAQDAQAGILDISTLDHHLFAKYLYTKDVPDPDLLIRTSGEQRISNYLLWQLAYAEFVFPKVLWPDFTATHLDEAITIYRSRERRFGKVFPAQNTEKHIFKNITTNL